MFFNSTDLDLAHAVPGTNAIAPAEAMLDALRRDYGVLAGMIFGDVPAFDDVMADITVLEERVNA